MRLRAVDGIPEVVEGDDLATMLDELDPPGPDDVVVIASTVVSKAEGRGRQLDDYEPSARATQIAATLDDRHGGSRDPRFAQAVIEESDELLLTDPFILAATRFGHIGVNAGIDRSNLPDGADILLLPDDPIASAVRVHERLDSNPPVIISDTSGRPFRHGQRGVAIGWAGLPATRDWRGRSDRTGHELRVTVEAVVDELAAAANLLAGEADDGLPVVYVEDWFDGRLSGPDRLFRQPEEDYVRQALLAWEYDPASRDR